jgi:nitroimidazol reductase NimA-like FMN-containing flavoprotein (pyridoxamine 5'-phosphate oxidase superfamily)
LSEAGGEYSLYHNESIGNSEGKDKIIDTMKALLKAKNMCVLATVWEGKPHTSLMAYVANDQGTELYMVTYRQTHKYRNMLKNPEVSLLIDTRDEFGQKDRGQVKALTVTGRFKPIEEEDKKETIRREIIKTHPHLKTLATHQDAEVIAIQATSFLLLDGPTESHFEVVT